MSVLIAPSILSADFAALGAAIAPTFIRVLPRTDAWGSPFVLERAPEGWTLIAPGAEPLGDGLDHAVGPRARE